MKRVAFAVLGCKVNHYEMEAMAGLFRSQGYTVVDFAAGADVYVVHTCAVTGQAERKSRQVIRKAVRANPAAVVAVTGCYSQIAAEQIARIPGVDVVIGTADRGKICELVEAASQGKVLVPVIRDIREQWEFEELPVFDYTSRTRASLKIEDGCNQFCSYCIVPYTRGPVRSRAMADILSEARRLAALGFKEIVLTGIHLGVYGQDLDEDVHLIDVLEGLTAVEGIARIRISSIEPTEVNLNLLSLLVAHPQICRHLHIPLQSGDDTVLRRMNRKYNAGEYLSVLQAVRRAVPDIGISTDVIVGFPGETDEQFANTYRLAEAAEFSRMHIFQYSRRTGTPAAAMPEQISPQCKEGRSRQLTELAGAMATKFHGRLLGKTVEVLAEQADPETGLIEGFTDNYVRVCFPGGVDLTGLLVPVRITTVRGEEVLGVPVS